MFATMNPNVALSLLAFWSDAGVDCLYEDSPRNRLSTPPRPAGGQTATVTPLHAPDSEGDAARDLAAEAKDLTELAKVIAAFDGCRLKGLGARQAVCWRGPANAPLMVIGEAPGAEEDAEGLPFVGRAGRLLDRMLSAAGLADRALIANTVFWRPPGNRAPGPDEQIACRPFLERTIEIVRPRLLLLLGASSARSMLDRTEGILALRGRWFEWRAHGGDLELPAMPTIHTAFLLRQPAAKKKAWEDFLLVAERLERPERPSPLS